MLKSHVWLFGFSFQPAPCYNPHNKPVCLLVSLLTLLLHMCVLTGVGNHVCWSVLHRFSTNSRVGELPSGHVHARSHLQGWRWTTAFNFIKCTQSATLSRSRASFQIAKSWPKWNIQYGECPGLEEKSSTYWVTTYYHMVKINHQRNICPGIAIILILFSVWETTIKTISFIPTGINSLIPWDWPS